MKILLCAWWLVVVPLGFGMFCVRDVRKSDNPIGFAMLSGYGIIFGAFQMLVLPMIFLKTKLHVLVWICVVLACLGMALSIKKTYKNYKKIGIGFLKNCLHCHWTMYLAIAIILFQVIVCVGSMHLDQDDAFYVATASTAVQTDTLYEIDPYMGFAYEVLPSRYVLSPFPIFIAVLSKLLFIHPTIVAHTILPAFLIPLSYVVYCLIGAKLFSNNKRGQGTFLLLIAVIQMFSFYSVYTAGTFMLLRIWQGKAILANILLPAIFYLSMRTVKEEGSRADWILLFFLMSASAMVSSMGVMLAPILLGIFVLLYGVFSKKWSILWKAGLCSSVNILCAIVYILIR